MYKLFPIFICSIILISYQSGSQRKSWDKSRLIVVNVETYRTSDDMNGFLNVVVDAKPQVIGINDYFESLSVPENDDVQIVDIEDIIPFELTQNGYLYLSNDLTAAAREEVNGFYSHYNINGDIRPSFALEVAQSSDSNLNVPEGFYQVDEFNYDSFTLAEIEYILENPNVVAGKIVLLGYVGDYVPDPMLLDSLDYDVFHTANGRKMYNTILQANFIQELLTREY